MKTGMVIYFGTLVAFIYIVSQNQAEIGKSLLKHVTSGGVYGILSRIRLIKKKYGFERLLNKILIRYYLEWRLKFILGRKISVPLGKFVKHRARDSRVESTFYNFQVIFGIFCTFIPSRDV